MKISSRSHSLLIALLGLLTLFAAAGAKAQRITNLQMFAGMNLVGSIGSTQVVQFTTSVSSNSQWTTLTNLVLTSTSQIYVDLSSAGASQRFYRAGPAAVLGAYTVTLLNINDPTSTNAATRGTNRNIIYSPSRLGRLTNQFTVPTASTYATGDIYFDVPYAGGGAGAYVFLGDTNRGSLEIYSVVSSTHLVVRILSGNAIMGTVYPVGTNVRQDGPISDTVATVLLSPFRVPAKGASTADILVNSLATDFLNAYVYIDGYAYQITAAAAAGPPPLQNQ